MKKFFTLIAAVAMAASVNAQTAKTFTKDTYLGTIPQNVLSWVSEGWVDKYGEDGPTLANKKGNINPETGEVKDKNGYNGSGIMLKSGNAAKSFKMHVTGVSSIEAYGVTVSSTDSRYLYVTATPDGGEAIEESKITEPGYTAVTKVTLDKTKTYTVEFTGKDAKGTGADVALHGVWVKVDGATGINSAVAEVESADADAPAYNLAGQKVGDNAKGIIIQNGKKYIRK